MTMSRKACRWKLYALFFMCGAALPAIPAEAPVSAPVVAPVAEHFPAPWKFYRSFARMTSRPRFVPHSLAIRCNIPSEAEMEQYREQYGPHLQAWVHVYANDASRAKLFETERQFPAGAVIVKEKLNSDDKVAGIGGMQKMLPGYDPEGGDWKYFYSDGSGKFAEGKLDNCRSCHMRERTGDHVFFRAGAAGLSGAAE